MVRRRRGPTRDHTRSEASASTALPANFETGVGRLLTLVLLGVAFGFQGVCAYVWSGARAAGWVAVWYGIMCLLGQVVLVRVKQPDAATAWRLLTVAGSAGLLVIPLSGAYKVRISPPAAGSTLLRSPRRLHCLCPMGTAVCI